MIYRKFVFLLLLLWGYCADAQHNLSSKTDHLTTRNGLPHNTIVSLFQDQTGYLWIGTANGLCRYNGLDFQPVNVPFGRGNHWVQVIQSIHQDRKGTLWFGSRSGEIFSYQFDAGSWKQCGKLGQQGDYVSCFYQSTDHKLWLGTDFGELYLYDYRQDSLIKKAQSTEEVKQIYQDDRNRIWVLGHSNLMLLDQTLKEQTLPKAIKKKLEGCYIAEISKKGFLIFNDSDSCFTYSVVEGQLSSSGFILNESGTFSRATTEYVWSSVENIMTYCIGDRFGYRYKLSGTYSNFIVNEVLSDHTGLIWIATDVGLIKLDRARYQFQAYSVEEGKVKLPNNYVRALYASGKNLWIGFKQGPVVRLYRDSSSHFFNKKQAYHFIGKDGSILKRTTINSVLQSLDKSLWCGGFDGLFKWNESKGLFENCTMLQENGQPFIAEEVWALCEDLAGRIWVGGKAMGLWVIDKQGISRRIDLETKNTAPVWDIYQSPQGKMWIGTNKGLYVLEENKGGAFDTRFIKELGDRNIWDIKTDGKGLYFIASTDQGLSIYDERTGEFKHYTTEEGLPSNSVCGLELDKEGHAWISTVNGLCRLNPANGKVVNFYEEDGLVSNDFNFKVTAASSAGELFFGTKNGLLALRPSEKSERTYVPSKVVVGSMLVNGEERINALGKQSFHYNENNVSFNFALLAYNRPAKHQYHYQLSPFDENWKQTDGRLPVATYTNLPPGNYTFRLKASADGVNWEQSKNLPFTIEPALWQRGWFIPALFLALLFIIVAFLRYNFQSRLKAEKEKNEVEKKMISLELHALQAQMNPHFIFNAINSIQHFMLKGDLVQANDYLTRFARLMRFYLEASINKRVRLSEELDMLKLYLELEKLRFDASFDYNIRIEKSVQTMQVEIPSMLLQPHVENAIHHGLATKKGKGHLTITIKENKEKSKLIITIEDNGIGRDEARKLRNTLSVKHQSRATQLLNERSQLINNLNEEHLSIVVIDKMNPDAKPEGTKVIITLSGNILSHD